MLVLSLAAHDILAKYLYAHPPLDVGTPPAAVGSMIMYYGGGDVVDVTILVLLGAGWYRVRGRDGVARRCWCLRDPEAS